MKRVFGIALIACSALSCVSHPRGVPALLCFSPDPAKVRSVLGLGPDQIPDATKMDQIGSDIWALCRGEHLDQTSLDRFFDHNQNGQIGPRELQAARAFFFGPRLLNLNEIDPALALLISVPPRTVLSQEDLSVWNEYLFVHPGIHLIPHAFMNDFERKLAGDAQSFDQNAIQSSIALVCRGAAEALLDTPPLVERALSPSETSSPSNQLSTLSAVSRPNTQEAAPTVIPKPSEKASIPLAAPGSSGSAPIAPQSSSPREQLPTPSVVPKSSAQSATDSTVSSSKAPASASDQVPEASKQAIAPLRDPQYWPQGYYPGDPLPPHTVYLTFDDGPCDFTGQVLDILKEENVRATFFMNSYDKDNPFHADTGKNLLFRYANVLRRMVEAGNVIGNHTYSHRDMADLSRSQINFQLNTLQRQLTEVLGAKTPRLYLIRPPFGSPWFGDYHTNVEKKRVCSAIKDRGIVMLWTAGWDSSDSFEWASGEWYKASVARYRPGGRAYKSKMEREMSRILRSADGHASGIILMHDTHPTLRDILGALIEELKRRGYTSGGTACGSDLPLHRPRQAKDR